jgi:hypothetical protein
VPGRKRPYDDAVPDDVLRCSVDDLLGVFRDGLLSLVPMAQRLGIEWRNDDRHRDWERLSEALFDACVRGPIEADAGLSFDELRLPRYDIDVASYRTNSWVTVASEGQHCPVVRLVTDAEPFDTVQFARLDPSCMQVVGHDVTPFGTARFAFVRRTSTGGEQVVEEITTGQPV